MPILLAFCRPAAGPELEPIARAEVEQLYELRREMRRARRRFQLAYNDIEARMKAGAAAPDHAFPLYLSDAEPAEQGTPFKYGRLRMFHEDWRRSLGPRGDGRD